MARKRKSKSAKSKQQQRRSSRTSRRTNADWFRRLQEWLLPSDGIFAELKLHGNTGWLPRALVWLALFWSWSASPHVTDGFTQAMEWRQLSAASLAVTTYQGFMKALVRWTDGLLSVLWSVLHVRMQEIAGNRWRVHGWLPLAFDGSRATAPRSESNENALCAPNYGHGKTARYRRKKSKGMRRTKNERNPAKPQEPQVWMTMLWHMSLRLHWRWKLGPSNSSERAHVMEMIDDGEFPENTLFCGDAGFVGYPLWTAIVERDRHFLVRVGANVQLLSERADCAVRLHDDIVFCWPLTAQQAKQPPLRLRLVRVRIGKQRMWMLTSVLQRKRLTRKQIVSFYKMRWGIEVAFRGLKQTLDSGTLRCRNSQRLMAELNWSIMGMVVAELFALKEQLAPAVKRSPVPDPKKRSLANTMRAVRYCLTHLNDVPAPGEDLPSRLRAAVTDSYVRKSSKQPRYRPQNPDKKPLGNPKIRRLTVKAIKTINAKPPYKSAA